MTKIELPSLSEAKTYLVMISLGLIINFIFWHLSFNGWYFYNIPEGSFSLNNIDVNNAMTLETLLDKYEYIKPDRYIYEQMEIVTYVQPMDKMIYPKDHFVFEVTIKNNNDRDTLWYPSMLVLITDSRDYVRGKTFIQLLSEDNGIKSGETKIFIFFFKVPEDMKGDNIYVDVSLYGESYYEYSSYSASEDILSTVIDDTYGQLPCDYQKNLYLGTIQTRFKTFPSYQDYVFLQPISMITSLIPILLLIFSYLRIFKARMTKFLNSDKGVLFIITVLIIASSLIILLISVFFYPS
jgi:hypothetical protein